MIDGLIQVAVGLLATAYGFGYVKMSNSAAGLAWQERNGRLFKIIGPTLIVIGLLLAFADFGKTKAPAPQMTIEGRALVFSPIQLRLTLPPEWQQQQQEDEPETPLVVVNATTGSALVGVVQANKHSGASLDEVLSAELESTKGISGDVKRGKARLGSVESRTAEFTATQNGRTGLVRLNLTATNDYTIGLSCFGGDEAALRSCIDLVATAESP